MSIDYEKIAFDTYKDKDMVLKGLEITKTFIKDKKLLLTGGMAIDLALKSIGHEGIYSENKLPDYDFFSPEFHTHAYELGNILCKQELPHISIINAIHVLTMKVRANFNVVADITFMDPKIYGTMPYIEYDGIRVIHPHFIMATQFIALSNPFDKYPMEAIMQRFEKDMDRLSLLDEKFPISKPTKQPVCDKQTFNIDKYSGTCISGWAAISYWMTYSKTSDSFRYDKKSGMITYDAPSSVPMELLSIHVDKFVNTGKNTYYNSYMDMIPRSVLITADNVRIFSSFNVKYSAFYDEEMKIHIICPPFILCKQVIDIIHNPSDDVAKYAYELLHDVVKQKADSTSDDKMDPLLPYPYVYGEAIYSMNFIAQLHGFLREANLDVEDEHKYMLPILVNLRETCDIPENVSQFDIKASEFFHADYQVTEPFHDPVDQIKPPSPHKQAK